MKKQNKLVKGDVLYTNNFDQQNCLDDFISEGPVKSLIDKEGLRLFSDKTLDPDENTSHWLLWNKQVFPDNIAIEFEFKPVEEPGLAMLFFCASGKEEKDLFDGSLAERDGQYAQYHSGDINTYHLSYFRRRWEDERKFHTCNLRKSSGFHLAVQAPDPIPSVEDIQDFYRIKVMKCEGVIQFYIDELLIFEWEDDGSSFGDVLKEGRIGFRQMAPLEAVYKNLIVSSVKRKDQLDG